MKPESYFQIAAVVFLLMALFGVGDFILSYKNVNIWKALGMSVNIIFSFITAYFFAVLATQQQTVAVPADEETKDLLKKLRGQKHGRQ